MNKRELEEHRSRNYWDQVHAANLMSAIRCCPVGLWRDDLMEAHLHLVFHFAHEENKQHDWCAQRGIPSVLELQKIVTRSSVNA
ncbi:hypothetical protein [Bradyrhizobium sp. SEMIA]|uniref:hypothetical protein n=1 Tax=Bradyrhizobium sp. SEMIA TaxID=2597515 RepID=UPI0018A34CEF|nr:hypothetical protein [Bradyrhizobium sp. SEMIA]QOG20410.1 hypothetical protein FOM02_26735 [Bradyrhizobium sp. SEMIA]